ncbi:uncharacterized protein BDZ99DRAFT_519605 [Mytilinidion resinicola]|uniref:Subtelomeric hrmA-associated cluster protein AFUB-079030/YDR124W-like helical bundle domain-containing protein n=1 Tax=Mytilinidion resinicola TaxID=574789 RepID=A0A6A6YQ63_9PEZI|nr:uncharacterized protein BDZ99DRAFT_519605 [Mytilinidion resinicola]KAF2810930.1 hypothetical protein BDZ99DRAFT_519605 [Mytilinidion resinicola]
MNPVLSRHSAHMYLCLLPVQRCTQWWCKWEVLDAPGAAAWHLRSPPVVAPAPSLDNAVGVGVSWSISTLGHLDAGALASLRGLTATLAGRHRRSSTMVLVDDENCSIPGPGPRGKSSTPPSEQKDGPSQAVGKTTATAQQPPTPSIALDPAIRTALTDSSCAWALTILHDAKRPASYYSSSNIERQKSVLFRSDGWQRIQRAAAARQQAPQAAPPSPLPETAPASGSVDDEPSTKRALYRSSIPRPHRDNGNLDVTPRKRRHSAHSLSAESSIDMSAPATPAAPRQRALPHTGDFTFQISDSECVKWALQRLLDQLQQISLKALETEWIKVAEPKKQSNFPYSRKTPKGGRKRTKDGPRIPKWWPIEESEYIEPHHNNKAGRTAVAVALLRLRDRGSGWVDKLEAESRRVSLYFCSNKCDANELEREQRRKDVLSCIFLIARYEEDYHFGCIDADFEVTAPDIPSVSKKNVRKKARTYKSFQVSARDSRATSMASPSTGSSPSNLVSPARNLTLCDNSSLGIRSPHQPAESPRRFLGAMPTMISQSGHTLETLPTRTLPHGNGHHQSFRDQSFHGATTTGLPDLEASHMRARHSYDYNAKPSVSPYDELGINYEMPRNQQYEIPQSPAPFTGWQTNPNLQPTYSVSTSFPPRHNSLNGDYQVTESIFPGRSNFSFQAPDVMTSTTSYQGPVTAASPMSMAPPMTRSYSQAGANEFQTANTPLPLSVSSPFQEGNYRENSGAGLQSYPMNGHNQYQ